MAHLGHTFDPSTVADDERSFDPLPEGEYACEIIESELKPTKTGGEMLRLTLEVKQGQHAGRRIWDNLNIVNSNAQAQDIAHRTLKSICDAVGVGAIDDSEALHFRPFLADVKIEAPRTVGDRTYDATNRVKRYKAMGGVKSAAPTAQARTAPSQGGPVRPAGRPWGNGAAAKPPF